MNWFLVRRRHPGVTETRLAGIACASGLTLVSLWHLSGSLIG